MSVPDEGYYRNVSSALNYVSKFVLLNKWWDSNVESNIPYSKILNNFQITIYEVL